MKDKCRRCGMCCTWEEDGELILCKYLRQDPKDNNKTYCKIYHKRLGTKIGKNKVCKLRIARTENFPNCLYNNKDWKMAYEKNE